MGYVISLKGSHALVGVYVFMFMSNFSKTICVLHDNLYVASKDYKCHRIPQWSLSAIFLAMLYGMYSTLPASSK